MDRAKKKFASAIDGLRSSLTNRLEIVVDEKVQPEHFRLAKIARHGFPDDARCIAYDAVQRLLAIGTGRGEVRIIGDAGVDCALKHEGDHPVNHLQFVINEGGLITTCGNDTIHLWNYRQKTPEIVHSVQLNKESVSCLHLPMGSKWLYVGTDKGNVYFVSVGTFQLSPYVINWNKAIDLSCRVHPGSVRQIGASPTEPTKLLIAFSKGALIQWNLVTKEVDRFPLDPPIKCFSWHYEGRLIMTGNVDWFHLCI
ncbi:Syntaxin-binding protein 5 [Parelaphostrongylus tenuis]|uniref:Syntaxin-binding protein 5 n=1 Tax=Parelaphostrongylus tenuis TaxID=148309 RepID=A0AAD5LV84_PARTN|nr:Syntaxin-binding protein 5 [Parelaphostrongylus tenuis]